MKGFKNIIVAACVLLSVNVNAQKVDSSKYNSAKDLIELENSKNLIPTTKNNPPAVLQSPKVTGKTSMKPKKTRIFSKKKKRI